MFPKSGFSNNGVQSHLRRWQPTCTRPGGTKSPAHRNRRRLYYWIASCHRHAKPGFAELPVCRRGPAGRRVEFGNFQSQMPTNLPSLRHQPKPPLLLCTKKQHSSPNEKLIASPPDARNRRRAAEVFQWSPLNTPISVCNRYGTSANVEKLFRMRRACHPATEAESIDEPMRPAGQTTVQQPSSSATTLAHASNSLNHTSGNGVAKSPHSGDFFNRGRNDRHRFSKRKYNWKIHRIDGVVRDLERKSSAAEYSQTRNIRSHCLFTPTKLAQRVLSTIQYDDCAHSSLKSHGTSMRP